MKWLPLIVLAVVLGAVPAHAQVTLIGGGGASSSLLFANGAVPISGNSSATACLQTNAGNTAIVLGSCGGSATYPAGSPPQFGGFSALNTSEAETLSGDCTFTRAGTNSYTIACTKTSGTAFGALATLGVGTGLTSSGGNLNLTVPVTVANGGSGAATFTAHALLLGEGTSAFGTVAASAAGNIVVDQGGSADFLSKPLAGDGSLTAGGVLKVLDLHFGGTNPVVLPSTAPTSGGVPYFSSATVMASSGALTLNTPVIGGGAGGAPSSGTSSGNTTEFATANGTLTSGDCVKIDASGNFVDAGGTCTVGGTSVFAGQATLSAGFVTVSNANITATSKIVIGAINDANKVWVSSETSGSFTIQSESGMDTAVVSWHAI